MNKSQQIMVLAKQGKTTREIARIVFATEAPTASNLAYVRVVKDQRKGRGASETELAYFERKIEADPTWMERRLARWSAHSRVWQKTETGRAYKNKWMRDRRLAMKAENRIG